MTGSVLPPTPIAHRPRATARLQLHAGYTLDDACAQVPYYAALGVSHLYLSPISQARAGSTHGYDVIDHGRVSTELGGEPALRRLAAAARARGLGLIADIVPNHMAADVSNAWWADVLRQGEGSPHARTFDIDWRVPDTALRGKVLLPVLPDPYGVCLAAGGISLVHDAQADGYAIAVGDQRYPVAQPPQDTPGDPAQVCAAHACGTPSGQRRLHHLLERQHYRLAWWTTAPDQINWRRFFEISELVGVRIDHDGVFDAVHALPLRLYREGVLDGLRIDHIDGLADPRGYCRKLRRRVDALAPGRHLPIFVEKILGQGETLHRDWCVDGSTGYEFMNQLSLLQHDPEGLAPLAELWHEHSGRPAEFAEEARLARQQILNGSLAGDFESVAQALLQVARLDVMSRDLTLGAIRRALQELIVHFPVYRTYLSACGRPASDEVFFQQALDGARGTLGEADWPVLDYLARWLGGQGWRQRPRGRERKLLKHACVRFQQLTSPAAAKAVEDTAFYRSAVLLSRNDVGFSTEQFSAPPADFHAVCLRRQEAFPDNLLTTATHDHKRGEDSRARLAVLSERAAWYAEQVAHWRQLAQPLRHDPEAPSAADELILYQALLGSWPLELDADDADGLAEYARRLWQWQEKALREAKLQSSWAAPNDSVERGVKVFIEALLLTPEGLPLRSALCAAVNAIAPAGALNSLAQSLLRMSVPGVPDLYQGNEFWDFSLVDPDNRRAVDFQARQQALGTAENPQEWLEHWRDGRVKQQLIAQVLARRAEYPALFGRGVYQPVQVIGEQAHRVLAFVREHQGQRALVIVPRLATPLLKERAIPWVCAPDWGDTRVVLPFTASQQNLKGLFSTQAVTDTKELLISAALEDFPVNLFILT